MTEVVTASGEPTQRRSTAWESFLEWFLRREALREAKAHEIPATEGRLQLLRAAQSSLELADLAFERADLAASDFSPAAVPSLCRAASFAALRAVPLRDLDPAPETLAESVKALESVASSPDDPWSPSRLAPVADLLAKDGLTQDLAASPQDQWARAEKARSHAAALVAAAENQVHRVARLRAQRVRRILGLGLGLAAVGLALLMFVDARRHANDLAANKPFRASSAYPPFSTEGRTNTHGEHGLLFHTHADPEPWVMVDLEAPTKVRSVSIRNRSDCCGERASPLVVELSTDGQSWSTVAKHEGIFDTWEATFPATTARYVRIRLLAPNFLHLERISVY